MCNNSNITLYNVSKNEFRVKQSNLNTSTNTQPTYIKNAVMCIKSRNIVQSI